MSSKLQSVMDSNLVTLRTTEEERAEYLRNCLEGRRVKHKLSAAFGVIALIVLLAATALAVTAITGHLRFMNPGEGPQLLSCTVMDDTLYMMTNKGLMQWEPGDDTPALFMDEVQLGRQGILAFSLPFASDSLMLLDPDNKAIWRYTDGGFEKILRLSGNITGYGKGSYVQPVAVGPYVYVRVMYEAERELWRIDLSNGQAEILPLNNIIELAAYREGQLLALQRDASDTDTVITLDAASGEILEEIVTMPIAQLEGLAYDAAGDSIYAVYDGMLCRWSGTDWTPLQTASLPSFSSYYCILDGGYAAAGTYGVEFINIHTSDTRPMLVIRGRSSAYGIEDDFTQARPDIQLRYENRVWFQGSDVEAALQENEAVDLFYVKLDATLIRMMRDGLLEPITGSELLADDAAKMLPQIQSVVAPEGTPYFVANDLVVLLWMIRDDADFDPPQSIQELLKQDVAWNTQPHPNEMFVASNRNAIPWLKLSYIRYALEQTLEEAYAAGQVPDFSADRFTAFLELLNSAELSDTVKPMYSSVITADTYFTLRGRASDEPELPWKIMDYPSVTAAQTDAIPARMYVYVLNPNSANKQQAMEFLEFVVQNRSAENQALLSPYTAESSLYAYVKDFPGLELQPDSWEVAEDKLARYQAEIAPRLTVSLSPYPANQNIMLDIVMDYLTGEITLEQCTEELNSLAEPSAAE